MSGTSLDGVDVALIETDGESVNAFGPSLSVPMSDALRADLSETTQAALAWGFEGPIPNSLSLVSSQVDAVHIAAIQRFAIEQADAFAKVEAIGYHGQTVAHDPSKGRSLQLGDGRALADAFGLPCVFDFRSADVAAGGEGAPLAPIFHQALVEGAGIAEGTAVLNLGGVGNVSVFTPTLAASDTGPANGPLDQWMAKHGSAYDADGATSLSGVPDFERVERWLNAPFFQRDVPRSADRYDFDVMEQMVGLSLADGAATLAAFTALSVKQTLAQMGHATERLILCGGGRLNQAMRDMLSLELDCAVSVAEDWGWDGDAIEAQAFAYLAARTLNDLPISFPATTRTPHPMVGGRIARPV